MTRTARNNEEKQERNLLKELKSRKAAKKVCEWEIYSLSLSLNASLSVKKPGERNYAFFFFLPTRGVEA